MLPFFLAWISLTWATSQSGNDGVESGSLVLTNIHIMNQQWLHVSGLGPWTDQLVLSAPEGSETFGSRISVDLDSNSGSAIVSHYGKAFIGIFRAVDFTVDILYPPQTTFSAQEMELPVSDQDGYISEVKDGDIIFSLIPSSSDWSGIKPVDLQGSLYGVDTADTTAFSDFAQQLPKIIKDHDMTMLVCTVSRRPKGLCPPYKILFSDDQSDAYIQVEAGEEGGNRQRRMRSNNSGWDLWNESPLTQLAPGTFTFGQYRQQRQQRRRILNLSSSSSSSSSTGSSTLDGDYRNRRGVSSSSSASSSSSEVLTPQQNQLADSRLVPTDNFSSFSFSIESHEENTGSTTNRHTSIPIIHSTTTSTASPQINSRVEHVEIEFDLSDELSSDVEFDAEGLPVRGRAQTVTNNSNQHNLSRPFVPPRRLSPPTDESLTANDGSVEELGTWFERRRRNRDPDEDCTECPPAKRTRK